ncbi:MAG: BlaI/MecI/CopY family transcriptional regulator [Synergistes sp.]|jgi:predicted transcriptional regulator|nr:BlaI/MecI/CopY family transcriptional regulator [Synergistes sp.]
MIIKDVSAAELEVMIKIWEAGKPTTIKDVWHAVGENKWTYQTVQTFVNRLHMKGFIEIVGKRVRSFEYVPCVTRAEYLALTKGHLFNGEPGASISDLLKAFYANGNIKQKDIEEIGAWLKEIED